MRFLLEPELDGTYDGLVTAGRAARDGGLDGVLLRTSAGLPAPLATAAVLAGSVPDIVIAAEIEVGERHPIEVAEEAAVVDLVCERRLVLVARPAPGAEEHFGEALDLMRLAWTSRPVRFEGRRWSVPAHLEENRGIRDDFVSVTPAPAQVRLELWGSGYGGQDARARGLGVLADASATTDELAAALRPADDALALALIGAPVARRDVLDSPDALVARLRDGQRRLAQDWSVIAGDAEVASKVGSLVRPRVMLDRLPAGLEELWSSHDDRHASPSRE